MGSQGPLDRRSFLQRTAAVGAGTALFSIVPSWGQRPAPSNRLQLGCIGVGGMGSGNLSAFLGQGDVQVVGVCDVDKDHATGAKRAVDGKYGNADCQAYQDFRELLARGDLDCISMATPDHWHSLAGIASLRAGCDVYGEKPLTHSLVEGRALVDACRTHGRIWQTGSWQRSVPSFHRAASLVRNGRVGKVAQIEVGLPTGSPIKPVRFSAPPPQLDYNLWVGPSRWQPYCPERVHFQWRWQLDFGGGQMMDWIGHHGDIAHWGMGWDETGPVAVEGQGEYPDQGIYDAATTYRFTATYANGVQMTVANDKQIRMGTKWIGADGRWIWVDRSGIDANPKSLLSEVVGPNEIQLYRSTDHHRNFLDCVKTRQPTITPAETAHRSASIGHLGQIAMRLGRKIRFNPATETIADDAAATSLLGAAFRAPWHL